MDRTCHRACVLRDGGITDSSTVSHTTPLSDVVGDGDEAAIANTILNSDIASDADSNTASDANSDTASNACHLRAPPN
jgi:hypothetical protein